MQIQPVLPIYILVPAAVLIPALTVLFVILRREPFSVGAVIRVVKTVAIALLCVLIGIRIMKEVPDSDVQMKNLDVLFVVDDTISMWAEDYNGSKPRMNGVRTDCMYIMQELDGANFGLIRFDNKAQILAPFTQDKDNVADALSTIQMPDRYYARGSSLNTPYQEMEALLKSSASKEDRQTIVYFISDGEITDGSQLNSCSDLAKYVDGGAVLGYGTAEGGMMKDTYGSTVYDQETHRNAVSCLDEETLRQIGQDLKIEYIHMDRQSNLTANLAAVRAGSRNVVGQGRNVVYDDLYYWFVLPLLALLAFDLYLIIRKRRL